MLIKIPFEFDRFFKVQDVVKSRIYFSTGKRGGGVYPGISFCLLVDGPITGGLLVDGPITGGRGGAYKRGVNKRKGLTAEYPATSKLYPDNSGYVAT